VTKAYDGTTTATLTGANFTVSGLYGTDSVSVAVGGPGYSARYASSARGTSIRVFATGLYLVGPSANDYVLWSSSTNAYIGTIN
jgi:hypothetical protein